MHRGRQDCPEGQQRVHLAPPCAANVLSTIRAQTNVQCYSPVQQALMTVLNHSSILHADCELQGANMEVLEQAWLLLYRKNHLKQTVLAGDRRSCEGMCVLDL